MNSDNHDIPRTDDHGLPEAPRSLRFWLKTVARLIAQESAVHDGRDVRDRIADAVPADDYATTVATLEAIARELGWDGRSVPARGHRGELGHRGHRMHGRPHGRGVGGGRAGDEVHVHVHVHGDHEHRGDRHRGHRRGRCAHHAG